MPVQDLRSWVCIRNMRSNWTRLKMEKEQFKLKRKHTLTFTRFFLKYNLTFTHRQTFYTLHVCLKNLDRKIIFVILYFIIGISPIRRFSKTKILLIENIIISSSYRYLIVGHSLPPTQPLEKVYSHYSITSSFYIKSLFGWYGDLFLFG